MDDLGYNKEEINQKIAQITFAFKNQKVIKWL